MWAFGKRANNRVIAMLMVVRGIVWVRQPGDYATFNSHQPRYATREPERQHCIVIDTATNTVIAMIQVGSQPVAFGVFIQPAPRFPGVAGSKTVKARLARRWRQSLGVSKPRRQL